MHPAPAPINVAVEWDDEAAAWVATSDDVPGLVAHDADFRALIATVAELVPILLAENGLIAPGAPAHDVPVHIAARARATTAAHIAA